MTEANVNAVFDFFEETLKPPALLPKP